MSKAQTGVSVKARLWKTDVNRKDDKNCRYTTQLYSTENILHLWSTGDSMEKLKCTWTYMYSGW